MRKIRTIVAAVVVSLAATALAVPSAEAQTQAPPGGDFQKVGELTELPDFVPGLGVLYVDPATLPEGPFLAYDRDGQLVSTIYMVPVELFDAQEALTGLGAGDAEVDHVDFRYNAGHPGVDVPHYHVILWHVSAEKAASLR